MTAHVQATGSTVNRYALDGKVVIVTGAGSGMGRAIARAFLGNGATVVAVGRRPEPLKETLGDAPASQAVAIPTDISDADAVRTLIDTVVERFGHLDVVVNCAAIYTTGDIAETAEDAWRRLFSVNVDGVFHLAKAALPQLTETRGSFIAITSVSGLAGDWGQSVYNSTKHAVNGLVRSLALDYGERGVRVNAVAPAFTETDLNADVWADGRDISAFTNRIALGRPSTPDDIAPAALFLASDDARYITGTVLTVDGGTTASTGQPHQE